MSRIKTPFRVIGIIPARLASTRLPGKVLREIAGQPMLDWVYRAARRCALLEEVVIATDSAEVMDFAFARGYRAIMTPVECASGTDRLHAAAKSVAADIYVNIQGDEPLLRQEHIEALLSPMKLHAAQVATLATACAPQDIGNPNAVKVVTRADGRALYFSRAAIPFDRDRDRAAAYRKHLGIYAYRREALARFPALPPSQLEKAEKLEQLRFLENGIDIHVAETPFDTIGVDTEEDLRRVDALLSAQR